MNELLTAENIWRKDFPMLRQSAYGQPLIYLDNAATTQQPEQVICRMQEYVSSFHSNIRRGAHYFGNLATMEVEETRKRTASFLHADETEEIIFTSGTTESISLAANGLRGRLCPGDTILATQMEHHSNYVPWQQICRQTGSQFLTVPVTECGDLDLDFLESLLKSNHVVLTAVSQVSNVTGAVNPVKQITNLCHAYGSLVLIDGAQGARHSPCNVTETDCDFYAFSAHKMMGPTGVGVLYGRRDLLETLVPLRYGGGMVDVVTEQETTFGDLPYRLEAGTPNIGGIVAFGESIQYLEDVGFESLFAYESALLDYLEERLRRVDGIRILFQPQKRESCISIVGEYCHAYDLASFLDKQGVAVRSGNLCAQPLLANAGIDSVLRISPAFYNTKEELDHCIAGLERTLTFLSRMQ